MKIEYVRNMQFAYMRIALSEPLKKTEEEMLAHNAIEGILPVRWQKENDIYLLRYDITGKQALDTLLENTVADERMLKCLLSGMCVAIRQLEKYLLPQEGLLLRPETIFWDGKTETMHFCFCPEESGELQGQLIRLMEYLLSKTDHKNIMAVQLAYGLYEEVLKPTFRLSDLEAHLFKRVDAEMILPDTCVISEEVQEDGMHYERESMVEDAWEQKIWKEGMLEKIMAWVKGKVQKATKRKKTGQPMLAETKVEAVEQEFPTMLLEEPQNDMEGILKYEGQSLLTNIVVSKVPFVIGSAGNCDGIIKHPTISRQHAKITYRDGTYFIEDLNSTNGTKVNGGLLSYKTKVSLKKNASVCFANEPYRFV